MLDVMDLKTRTDLIALVERDTTLKRKTHSGEHSGPCPFCGGRDRFSVQADKWLCRNCTQGKWQDAIAYVMRRENCDFLAACNFLGAMDTLPVRSQVIAPAPEHTEPPAEWQADARRVIMQCVDTLWSNVGAKAREYLHSRGLNDETVRRWQLGYLPGSPREYRTVNGLRVPCGIVIPCEIADAVWYVKVRRASGEPKYENITGGRSALFGADMLTGKRTAIITEGEFDAMLLHQIAGDVVDVATPGSASTYPSEAMLDYLLPAREWLICYDLDEAGDVGAAWWLQRSDRARRVWLPKLKADVKDVSDYWRAGGDLREWVTFQIGDSTDTNTEELADARTQRDALVDEWQRLLDQADALPNDSPDVDRILSKWKQVDAAYRQACDLVAVLELTQQIKERGISKGV